MFTPGVRQPQMSAADARARLTALCSERLDAAEAGLAGNATYMAELDADIAAGEHAYVSLAVAEIASLRADIGGELLG